VVQKTKINDERHEAMERTMSITVTIEEAQANLKDLVHRLAPGFDEPLEEMKETME
jgi:signal transduction histidine kinase